jgi:hypothetical protein
MTNKYSNYRYQRFDAKVTQIPDCDIDARSLRDLPASPPHFEAFKEWRDEFNKLKALGTWRTENQRLTMGDLFITLWTMFNAPVYVWDREYDADVMQAAIDAFKRYQQWARAEEKKNQE